MAICTLCGRAVNDDDVNSTGRCVLCAGQRSDDDDKDDDDD